MPSPVVVVNGPPGAGKTTLAGPLAKALGARLVAKDAIKEALSDAVGGGLATSPLGGIALDALWAIAALVEGPLVLESTWATDRDEAFFVRGWASLGAPPGVEVWCRAPVDVMLRRFTTRDRHPAHEDAGRVEEWRGLVSRAAPITGLPVVEVDTARPVDVPALAAAVRAALPPA